MMIENSYMIMNTHKSNEMHNAIIDTHYANNEA